MKQDYPLLLETIESLKRELAELRLRKPEDEARLWRMQRMEWNYQANRFEGNRLSLSQTELLLDHDLSFESSFREVAEMKAHDTAVELAREWSKDPHRPLTASDILELHQIVSVRFSPRKSLAPQTGHLSPWNKVGNRFLFARAYQKVRIDDIHKAIALQSTPKIYRDAFSAVNSFFYQLLMTKPYDENNVRVPLLTANLMFMRAGYPPISFRLEDKTAYFQAFKEMGGGAIAHPDGFFRFVAQQMIVSLKKAIAFAKGEGLGTAHDVIADIAAWKEGFSDLPEGQVEKNDKLVFMLYERDWAPLIQRYESALTHFEDMFKESNVKQKTIYDGSQSISFYTVDNEIQYRKTKNRPDYVAPVSLSNATFLLFKKEFLGFKFTRVAWGHVAEVRIQLRELGYEIYWKETLLRKIEYNQPLTNEVITEITESFLKISLEEFKSMTLKYV
jgi:hypothetical protein